MRLQMGLSDSVDITNITFQLSPETNNGIILQDAMLRFEDRIPEILNSMAEDRMRKFWGNYIKAYAVMNLLAPDRLENLKPTTQELVEMENTEYIFSHNSDYIYYLLAFPAEGLAHVQKSGILDNFARDIANGQLSLQDPDVIDQGAFEDLLENCTANLLFTGQTTEVNPTKEHILQLVAKLKGYLSGNLTAVFAASVAFTTAALGPRFTPYLEEFNWQAIIDDIQHERQSEDALVRLFHLHMAVNPNFYINKNSIFVTETSTSDANPPLPVQLVLPKYDVL